MTRFLKTFLLLALIASAPTAALAEVEDGTRVNARMIASLMVWVEGQTGVHVPAMPQVIASREAFQAVLSRMNGRFAGHPRAMYVSGGVLLDSEYWDEEDEVQVSLLVHELVHYAQSFMHTTWTCSNEREVMAYTLQNKWLEQHDQRPFVKASWINRMSSCGDTSTRMASAR